MGGKITPHLPDEFPGRIWSRGKAVGNFSYGAIADLQFLLIDIGIVDSVNVQTPQFLIVHMRTTLIVTESQGFEEIHVHNRRPGGYNDINHIVTNQVRIDLHAARCTRASRNREDYGTVGIGKHLIVYFRGHGKIPRRKRHAPHGLYDLHCIDCREINMFHGSVQIILFLHKFSSLGSTV
ncbi:MAG: hypothetical protein A4E66_01648 [Syntrophus sp. PtaB.Bin001]|nr:MAG: hypothetical protein A4E66_01648 [Syntrophus sp. PtaB.Bin001]